MTNAAAFHPGIPSPPSDGLETSNGQRIQYNGNESDTDVRMRSSERLSMSYSPDRSTEVESPGECVQWINGDVGEKNLNIRN